MAGEIKINDVSIATESGGTVTLGNATLGSTVVLGTNASPIASNLVLAAGNGIDFSAASGSAAGSSSAVLDDYEEGTWTPVLSRDGSAPTISYSGRPATYVKIGQMVYCMAEITISSITAAGSGLNLLSDLPFTPDIVSGGGGGRWCGYLGYNSVLSSADSFYVIAGSTFGYFYNLPTNTNPNTNYGTGQMFITIVYKAA